MPGTRQLISSRLCTIDQGLYMIFDWYEAIDGQPLTCIIQVNQEEQLESGERIKPPVYCKIAKDITDMVPY